MTTGRKWLLVLALVVAAAGLATAATYERIAVRLAPGKKAIGARSAQAVEADSLFWRIFHGAEYDQLPHAIEVLTRAYLETPNDAVTAAHLAWLHMWRSSERTRLDTVPAGITDATVLARRYFQEAVALDPSDARYLGFLAGATLAEGSIHKDERLTRRGYFMLRDAIDAWPEFNLFTGGYIMSRLPPNSPRFTEGLEWEWKNLDVCIETTLDRANPDYARYMALETREGPKRACWNSWIAPHNLEGFFLNMGDMLVKSGDWQTARRIYANAKLSREYDTWRYRDVLEERIRQAEGNVARFNGPDAASRYGMMINSSFSCVACHAR